METVPTLSFQCVPQVFSGWDVPLTALQGLPGIGKTTSIHCLAHQLLGDAYKEGVLELNASDERYFYSKNSFVYWFSACCSGIDVVRNKIKAFAQKKVTLPPGRHKIVILDEADRYEHLVKSGTL